ncbi:MAG: hypothetical protein KFW21_00450 [Spirochaetota bacterium]|nr:hypothetical protein [Spirochaetota bacterium]
MNLTINNLTLTPYIKNIKQIMFIVFLFLTIVKCSNTQIFDKLYYNQEYDKAYEYLKNNNTFNSLSYQERELKVLLHLAISDVAIYLPLLDEALLKDIPQIMTNWNFLSRSWIRFLSAETDIDYQNILFILPRIPFQEKKIEQLRLIIQTHSLSRLKKYQEALAYLNASDLTDSSSDLIYIKGIALQNLNQFDQAKKTFKNVINISTNNKLKSLSYFHLGNILVKEKNLKQAEKYYMQAWNLNPYQAELNFQIGKILRTKSYSDLHYRYYRASLRLNENLAEAWYYLNL